MAKRTKAKAQKKLPTKEYPAEVLDMVRHIRDGFRGYRLDMKLDKAEKTDATKEELAIISKLGQDLALVLSTSQEIQQAVQRLFGVTAGIPAMDICASIQREIGYIKRLLQESYHPIETKKGEDADDEIDIIVVNFLSASA